MNRGRWSARGIYSTPGIVRFLALHVHAAFPFLLPMMRSVITARTVRGFVRYLTDWRAYNRSHDVYGPFPLVWRNNIPCLEDRYLPAGLLPRHYFLQDVWAARKVAQSHAPLHFDIGSRLDGFIGHCLSFCDVVMMDVRPLPVQIKGLSFKQVDCTDMEDVETGSVASLSSLHAIEHFGLGRYGDRVDPMAWKKALTEMQRILSIGGQLYLSVPVGVARLEFNGGRVFGAEQIVEALPKLKLLEFSFIDDDELLHENVALGEAAHQRYGCGLFHFSKA